MHDPGTQPDFTRASGVRVYNTLLGGKDNFAPDREAAERLEQLYPGVSKLVQQHREFARRVARWLHDEKLTLGRGIGQFLDIGCGLPARPTVAEVVPCAKVAYVDADPVALAHLRALASGDGIAVVGADASRPDEVLAAPELAEVIDLQQPVGILLAGVLSAMDPEAARRAVAGYAGALTPGSAIAACCVSYRSQQAGDEAAAAYRSVAGGTFYSHSKAAIRSFFADAGLHLAQCGVGDVRAWWEPVSMAERPVSVLGGVGIVPLPSRRRTRR